MNKGKICVSICAQTALETLEKIKAAQNSADIIEIRLDCLEKSEIPEILNSVDSKSSLLLTLRPKDQGGKRDFKKSERLEFWQNFLHGKTLKNAENTKFLIDLEFDIKTEIEDSKFQKIISFHDFQEAPRNLESIFDKLADEQNIAKIAVQANEITDSISVWKLLEKAKAESKKLIPIAMGEAGKWTRILGLAFGSPVTYASPETGNETAPGQISAEDLEKVYRVKKLNEQTEIYGIIGNPVAHSLSPLMHNAAFKFHDLNAVYIPFEVKNLDEFIRQMVREETREIVWNLKGFSVTIPHKETIIKHLDFISEDAEKIGAVNTVKIIDGKFYGFNTDAHGFIEPLKNAYGSLENVNIGIIGSGGAARACVYALKKEKANVTIFARNHSKAKNLAGEFRVQCSEFRVGRADFVDVDILVNTTPLGTSGELENKTPAAAEHLKNLHMVYDLVYNPFETLFIVEAKSVGIPTLGGLAMLVAQGMKQFEIWTERKAPLKEMSRAALQRLK